MLKDHPSMGGADVVPNDIVAPLILDFLQWLAPGPRPYAEVMETWRTSCPRLAIWESAVDGGYVIRRRLGDRPATVEVTAEGIALLERAGRPIRVAAVAS